MIHINLKQLEVFVAVVEQGGFTKAAEYLYLAQSTVSKHIQVLEEELKTELLYRETKKQLLLTAEGQRVYQHAKEILNKCRALEEDIYGEYDQELVIGAPTLMSQNILPMLVAGFINICPECTCIIKNGDSEQIHQMLMDGTIQIGFAGVADNRHALAYERITEDHLVMITANTPRYQKFKEAGLHGRDLLGEPFVLRQQGSATQKVTDNYFSSMDLDPGKLRVVARVSSPDVLRDMVANGAGVSILYDSAVRAQVAAGELLQFELDEAPIARQIYMLHRKKGPLSDCAKQFIAYARDTLQNL